MADDGLMKKTKGEAADWWADIATGLFDPDKREAFERWYGESPDNQRALSKQAALWDALGDAALDVSAAVRREAPPPLVRKPMERRAVLTGSIAASLAGVFLAYRPPFGLWPSLPELRAEYRTVTGEQKTISTVPDVSIVMNTATSLDLAAEARGGPEIRLVSGEVAVVTNGMLSRAVRIAFTGGSVTAVDADVNIFCAGPAVEVTCLRGRTDFTYRGETEAVYGGEQVSRGTNTAGSATGQIRRDVTGWREGRLIFKRVPLSAVIAEVNRYRPGRIVLLNATLGERFVDAVLPQSSLDEIVAIVRETYKAHVTELPAGIVLIS